MKYFYDAVKLGSITLSAKANFVTQSAVTQGIDKLEKSIGCELIAHYPNRFKVTAEGEQVFIKIADILKGADELKQQFSKDYEYVGDLSFACIHSFALALIPAFIKRFHADFPFAKINFACSAKVDEIKHMLKTGQIDFGIAPNIEYLPGFEQKSLSFGNYGLYVSNKIDPKQEKNLKFILPNPDTTQLKEIYFNKYRKPLDVFLEVGSWEVLARLCAEGLGIGCFPDYIASKKIYDLRQITTDMKLISYGISAFYLKGFRLRKSTLAFLSYFSEKPETN